MRLGGAIWNLVADDFPNPSYFHGYAATRVSTATQRRPMQILFVRRRILMLAAITATVALAACEDKRVKELNTGITRDSAITVIAQDIKGGGRDSLPNVYKSSRFLIAGKTYEVLYFTPNNEKAGKDTVPMKKLTPLVFVDNQLVAKGWPAWDSVSKANNIPIVAR